MKNRILFIDWMKVLGMYFIILGHLFPAHHEYIYAFNVPLFFIISGILLKREESQRVFWKKLWHNLVLPLIIICFVNFFFDAAVLYARNQLTIEFFWMRPYALIVGNGHGDYGGLRSCWFIYTLVLIKIIFQYFYKTYQQLLVFLFCIIGTLLITRINIETTNSFPALCTAYPFVIIGYYIKHFLFRLEKQDKKYKLILLCLSVIVYFFAVNTNECVWMYMTRYGGNYFSFWLGAISGFFVIYVISSILSGLIPKVITNISSGTIIILGYHQILLFFYKYWGDYSILQEMIYSCLVLIVFHPVIICCKRYIPFLLGMRAS